MYDTRIGYRTKREKGPKDGEILLIVVVTLKPWVSQGGFEAILSNRSVFRGERDSRKSPRFFVLDQLFFKKKIPRQYIMFLYPCGEQYPVDRRIRAN